MRSDTALSEQRKSCNKSADDGELPSSSQGFQGPDHDRSEERGIDPVLIENNYWVVHGLYGLQQAGYQFEPKGGIALLCY